MTVDEIESYEGASGSYTSKTIEKEESVSAILQQIEVSLPGFSEFISPAAATKKINEEVITQEIVLYLLAVQNTFRFVQENKGPTRGKEDIGVYPYERVAFDNPYFVLEAKRLPAPPPVNKRKKEYVSYIDDENKRKGGIERFKLAMHGPNMHHCGMIGYVEKETFAHWLKEINEWINDLATIKSDPDVDWKKEEELSLKAEKVKYAVLDSICLRKQNGKYDKLKLSHFWVKIL